MWKSPGGGKRSIGLGKGDGRRHRGGGQKKKHGVGTSAIWESQQGAKGEGEGQARCPGGGSGRVRRKERGKSNARKGSGEKGRSKTMTATSIRERDRGERGGGVQRCGCPKSLTQIPSKGGGHAPKDAVDSSYITYKPTRRITSAKKRGGWERKREKGKRVSRAAWVLGFRKKEGKSVFSGKVGQLVQQLL